MGGVRNVPSKANLLVQYLLLSFNLMFAGGYFALLLSSKLRKLEKEGLKNKNIIDEIKCI